MMTNRRIKLTTIPRLALGIIALLIFFGTLYSELVGHPIDFTQPIFAGIMVGFLFLGITMLAASWVIGLDTRAEIYITLFMISLHIFFDAYIFVRVFALGMKLPVPLVQGVVQAYWIAGLLDALLMYWASNWERTEPDYEPIEARYAALQRRYEVLEATTQVASRMYQAACPMCDRVFNASTQDRAEKAVAGHKPHCKGIPIASNGHRPIHEIADSYDPKVKAP